MFGAMLLGGMKFLLIALVLAPLALLSFAFWIWMLVHAITNKGLNDIEKLIGVLVILFLHFIGGLIYFLIGRAKASAAAT